MQINQALQGKRIAILGCGWLGLALGKSLVKSGALVKGTTTSSHKLPLLQESGITPFLVNLAAENALPAEFIEVDSLVVAVPPKADNGDFSAYLSQLPKLVNAIQDSTIRQLIFVSSTGVYPENAGEVLEADAQPHSQKAQALLQAEEMMQQFPAIETIVIRFGGLFGTGRHPGRFLAGKTNVPNGNSPINFIHQTDAVNLIVEIIAQGVKGTVFHACADRHPVRQEFYAAACQVAGLAPPEFNAENQETPTLVNSSKIKLALGYSFVYPDPLAALASMEIPVITGQSSRT